MNDTDTVVPQGEGRQVDCPLCGVHRLYIFSVGGLQFVNCGECHAAAGRLAPDLTIAQLKDALVQRSRS